MTEIIVESAINETVIDINGGPTLSTVVGNEAQTIVSEFVDPVVIDLNSGPRGEPGAAILTGEYPPDPQEGVMGDMYIVTQGAELVGEVFRKSGPMTWVNEGNVRGPAGGVNTVNGYTGPDVTITKTDLGLSNVDNTSDVLKPISTATQTALNTKIPYNDWLQYRNPFNGVRRVYLNELHNGLFRADARFNVVAKRYRASDNVELYTLSAAEVARFFDSNYEGQYTIPVGEYLVVTITFPNETGAAYPGYPYGKFFVSHYHTSKSANSSARFYTEYAPHGGPAWKNLAKSEPVNLASSYVVQFDNPNYQITAMEFRIDAPTTGTANAAVTQIEMMPDRPGANETPYVDKYRMNRLYSSTIWREGTVDRVTIANTGAITATSFSGSGAALTALNGSNISTGTVPDARLSTNQATLSGAQTFSGTKTFSSGIIVTGGTAENRTVVNLGNGYGAGTAGIAANIKLKMYDSGATNYGIGISAARMEYQANQAGGKHTFYIEEVARFNVEAAGATVYGALTATSFSGSGAALTGLTKTQVGLANVTNDAQVTVATAQTVTGAKTFSGAVIVPTPTAATHAAHKQYVDDQIFTLTNGSPELLNTLDELAAAIGDDPNFATTMTNNLALKAPIDSPTFTGTVGGITKAMVGLGNVNNAAQVDLTSAQTIAGVKTFSSAPVVPLNSFAIDKVSGLQTALDAKQPTIVAGTTAQYYRGDKTWQTLDKSAVGLGNVNNVAQVDLSSNQSIAGTKTFTTTNITTAVITSLHVGPSSDHGYISFRARDAAPTTRSAFVGVGSAGSVDFSIHNEMTNGNIRLTPNGTGVVSITAGGGLSVSTGSISGSGSGITNLNASNLASGTVPQDRVVPNVRRFVFTTAGTARPTGATYVEWMGPVQPTNMIANDTWINTGA